MMNDRIELFNKKQPVLLISLFLLLVGGGALYLLFNYIYPKLGGFFNLKVTAVVSIVAIVIWAIFIVIRHSSRKKPGLIIDSEGITNRTNITSTEFIPWRDITGFKEIDGSFKHKLIVVELKNPGAYINKTPKMSASRRVQFRQTGSPILITATTLEYDPNRLVALLKERIKN
ncbi:MAG: STM3941 family protein [Anaerolineaceae bacterium]|nr:STM3941 family protein [Anaerolineaceae bacterium]